MCQFQAFLTRRFDAIITYRLCLLEFMSKIEVDSCEVEQEDQQGIRVGHFGWTAGDGGLGVLGREVVQWSAHLCFPEQRMYFLGS